MLSHVLHTYTNFYFQLFAQYLLSTAPTYSVTGYGHPQEATNFIDVGAVNNKYFETSLKWKFACNGRLNREGVTLNLQTKFFSLQGDYRIFILLLKPTLETTPNQVQRFRAIRRVKWARAALFAVGRLTDIKNFTQGVKSGADLPWS